MSSSSDPMRATFRVTDGPYGVNTRIMFTAPRQLSSYGQEKLFSDCGGRPASREYIRAAVKFVAWLNQGLESP